MMSKKLRKIAEVYLDAKKAVISSGFDWEIEWQASLEFSRVTETDFLRESAWVILNSGMREKIISRIFPHISSVFFDWESAKIITKNAEKCRLLSRKYFNHDGKINAIINIAKEISNISFELIKREIKENPLEYLITLPYIGKITCRHLAKNLGLPIIKPDRHLTRIAKAVDYSSPQLLCEELASLLSEKQSVIDVVLWRFATLESNYLSYFSII